MNNRILISGIGLRSTVRLMVRSARAWLAASLLLVPGGPAQGEGEGDIKLQRLGVLTAHTGQPFDAGLVRDRPYALFFGFTHCPDICPTTLLQMSNLLRLLGPDGDRLTVLFVTVDPERDTPEHIRSYLDSFDRRIVGLSGSAEEIKSVAGAWKAAYDRIDEGGSSYSIAHAAHVYLMDRAGRQRDRMNFQEDEAVQLEKLKALLAVR